MTSDNSPGRTLYGRTQPVQQLDAAVKEGMFALMSEFYEVEKTSFLADLERKNTVILLEDGQKNLRGFTSVAIYDLSVGKDAFRVLFSGDTIIHPDFWGSLELPRVWGRFMYETLQASGEKPLYWFLISSGYRTYRFLPAYFNEFFPCFDRETPAAMQNILDLAARQLFAEDYNPDTSIVRLKNPTPLRAGISEPAQERLQNQHIAFFLQKNPGHDAGDELACITRLSWENFKPFVKRLLKG